MKNKKIRIGIAGLGTVGSGVVNLLDKNKEEIFRRTGFEIEIAAISATDKTKQRDCDITGFKFYSNPLDLIDSEQIDIIVELIGGDKVAKELVLKSIKKNIHVVTANKALIALHGNEISEISEKNQCDVAFEASVAGAVPIIKVIRESLSANKIFWIAGIINGTTNFILTKMLQTKKNFDDVLEEAKKLGYAEADPAFDIGGIDAAHKLTIIGSIAFGIPLQFDKTYTEGITQIEQQDVVNAAELGYRIKHLGITRKTDKGIELRVHPTLIPERRLIANVDGVMNAVLVYGDAVGPTLYYGAGAGAQPTASAIVADVVDVVRALTTDPENRVPHLAFQPDAMSDIPVLDIEEIETAYYLRLSAVDRPGVLANVTSILGASNISIEAIIQKPAIEGSSQVPVIFLTQRVQEKNMNEAIRNIEALDTISGQVVRIRVETLK